MSDVAADDGAVDIFDTGALMRRLERQRELYHRLRVLAERQKTLVVQEDSQPLLSLLGERQGLVDELLSLNTRLAPYRRHWTEVYGRLDETGRRRVTTLLEEANSTLGSILRSDRQDTATLTARRETMAGRLSAAGAGSRASAAYRVGAGAERSTAMSDVRC